MNAIRRSVFLLWLPTWLALTAHAQLYQGRQLVHADALANVSAIVPGEPFLVGVRLKMEPRWHTYWKYPGDAGIPTEIRWQLPEGWRVGDIQWPIPLKLEEPGDILIYGYHDEVLLIQQVTPPKDLTSASANLSAKVSWLVCEKICIPGDGTVTLSLPIAPANSPANTDLFARFQKQLPTSPAADSSASWKSDAGGLVLRVSHPDLGKFSSVEFFPSPPENVAVGHPRLTSRDGNVSTFDVPLDNANGKFKSLPGLLVFGSSNGAPDRSAWDISVGHETAAANEKSTLSEIIRFLIFGFIGGFILNLMPCVLPVISLKIFGFVQQAGQSRARIFRSGLAFIAGIFVWFLGLALVLVIIKTAGGQPVWAAQFTNPYFVLAMSAVVLVFALNLFGVFEINLPQWLSRRAVAAESAHGDAGSFFQGVFATILATPCTAPFLGTALGFAFTQSAIVILAIFSSIALGMSLPYFLLSAQPAWLKFLPKPGAWMERFKVAMGFPMLATVVWLFKLTLNHFSKSDVFWFGVFLVALSMSAWIWGEFVQRGRKRRGLGRAASVLVTGAVVLLAATRAPEIEWKPWSHEAVAAARAEGRPVLVDFTADWCSTCQVNMRTSINIASVRRKLGQIQAVTLVADFSKEDPAIAAELQRFQRDAVPLVLVYPKDPNKPPIVLPDGYLTPKIVLDALDKAAQ